MNRYERSFARRIGIFCVAAMAATWALGAVADDKQPTIGSQANGDKPGTATLGLAGGGFGGGVSSGPVFLAASKAGKTLYGYSVRTGTWDKVRLDNPVKAFDPILTDNEGCVVVGKRVYAFSGIVGRWDSIEIAESKEPPIPILEGKDVIRVEVGTKIYMFSAITGRWAVADLSVDAD